MASEYIAGYRPGTEGSSPKMYSVRHLMLSREASQAQTELYKGVWEASDAGKRVPCYNNPEPFTGENLPTEREAQALCAPCPVRDLCSRFAELSEPTYGVYAGQVFEEEEVE